MLETNRLLIRLYSKGDKASLYNTISRYEIYRTTYGIPQACTMGYAAKWISRVLQNARENRSYEYAVINKLSGEYVGNVGLINIDFVSRRCDISYFIHPDFWNRGFAAEAAAAMVKYSFDVLNMNRVGGMCMEKNAASAKVMEKLLMKKEGVLRDYFIKDGIKTDAAVYSILRKEYDLLLERKE